MATVWPPLCEVEDWVGMAELEFEVRVELETTVEVGAAVEILLEDEIAADVAIELAADVETELAADVEVELAVDFLLAELEEIEVAVVFVLTQSPGPALSTTRHAGMKSESLIVEVGRESVT